MEHTWTTAMTNFIPSLCHFDNFTRFAENAIGHCASFAQFQSYTLSATQKPLKLTLLFLIQTVLQLNLPTVLPSCRPLGPTIWILFFLPGEALDCFLLYILYIFLMNQAGWLGELIAWRIFPALFWQLDLGSACWVRIWHGTIGDPSCHVPGDMYYWIVLLVMVIWLGDDF